MQPAPIPDLQTGASSIKVSLKGRAFSYGLHLRYGHAGVQQEFVNGVFVFRELPVEPDPETRGRSTEMRRSTAEAIVLPARQGWRALLRKPSGAAGNPCTCPSCSYARCLPAAASMLLVAVTTSIHAVPAASRVRECAPASALRRCPENTGPAKARVDLR
jgi:hypothetical protein